MSQPQFAIWQEPAKEIAETLFDESIDDIAPFIAKLPLVSVVDAVIKSGRAVGDYLLARKVQLFYEGWEVLAKPERKTIYDKFRKKPRDFIEKLLFIIDKQESEEKCRLLGGLTTRYLRADIRRADFYELIETVAQLTWNDLLQLANLLMIDSLIFTEKIVTERYANTFIARGLVETAPHVPREQRSSRAPMYRLTKLGKVLAESIRA